MVSLADFKKDLALFVECGLISIKQGDEESAKKLFAASKVLDPQNSVSEIGEGLIALHKLELRSARSVFEGILAKEKNYRAQAFLSLTYLLSALREKAQTDEMVEYLKKAAMLADEVIAKADIESSKQLAQSVLDWQKEIQEKAKAGAPGAR